MIGGKSLAPAKSNILFSLADSNGQPAHASVLEAFTLIPHVRGATAQAIVDRARMSAAERTVFLQSLQIMEMNG